MVALKLFLMLQIIRVQARPEFPPVPAGFRLHKCSLSAPVQIETFIDPAS